MVAKYKITPAFKHLGVLYLVSFQHDSEFSIVNRSRLNPDLLLSYCHHTLTELLFFFFFFIREIFKSIINSSVFRHRNLVSLLPEPLIRGSTIRVSVWLLSALLCIPTHCIVSYQLAVRKGMQCSWKETCSDFHCETERL